MPTGHAARFAVVALCAAMQTACGPAVLAGCAWADDPPSVASAGDSTVIAPDAAGSSTVEIVAVSAVLYGPSALDTFRSPVGLSVDARRGMFFVADTGHQRLAVFDATGRCRGTVPYSEGKPVPAPATGAAARAGAPSAPSVATLPSAAEPRSIAADSRGRLYVVDGLGRNVEVLTAQGSHLAWLEPQLPGPASADRRPEHVSVGASGRIYIVYSGTAPGLACLAVPDRVVFTIGLQGDAAAMLRTPVCAAVDAAEREIAVVDPEGARAVHLFNPDGTELASFGAHGEAMGTFSMAVHVAWGPRHTLWVTDTLRHSISVFDDRGRYLGRIGGFGNAPGEFNYPAACAFLGESRLVVLERAGARCQILEVETPGLHRTQTGALPAEPNAPARASAGAVRG